MRDYNVDVSTARSGVLVHHLLVTGTKLAARECGIGWQVYCNSRSTRSVSGFDTNENGGRCDEPWPKQRQLE